MPKNIHIPTPRGSSALVAYNAKDLTTRRVRYTQRCGECDARITDNNPGLAFGCASCEESSYE